jgi:hypothetical protein
MTNISQSTPLNTELLNFQQQGEGEHVILIHGLFGSLENLRNKH